MAVTIATVSPGLGDSTQPITLEITGTGFLSGARVSLISPTNPPIIYSLSSPNLLSNTVLHVLIAANSVPVGIYDVEVDNGGTDNFVLTQSYRSAPLLPQDPWSNQTFDTLMTRVMSNINPAFNPTKYDTRVGQVPWDLTAPMMTIVADYWKALFNVLLQGFAQNMGGTLLQLRAEEHGVIKKIATFATGVVQTTAPVGTLLQTGMVFSTSTLVQSATGVQTFTSSELVPKFQQLLVTGTASSADAVSLTDSSKAWAINIYQNAYIWIRLGTGAGQIRKISFNTATSVTPYVPWGIGLVPDVTSQYTIFSGVDVVADFPGQNGNILANAITRLVGTNPFITAVTNPVAFSGGAEQETDAALLSRFLLTVRSPSAGGNVNDYENWAAQTPGVNLGSVSVIPIWAGAGTVKVVIINADNTVPNASVVAAVQAYIDPSPGLGLGKAPVGATVTVQAATAVAIDVSVVVSVVSGVNASTVRSQVLTSIQNYLNSIPVGTNVLLTLVENAIMNSSLDANGNHIRNFGVLDFDLLTATHGIKKSTSGTYLTTNITILGTEKPVSGTILVS